MKENKRAFTLIELLAVIVVLTIILLITVPAINEVIKNSRKESFRNNVLNLFESVKKLESTSDFRLDENGIKYNDKRLNISNNPFTGGKIYLNENGEADSDKITDDRFCAVGTKKKLLIAEGNCDLAAALSNIDFKQKPSKQGWYRGKEITVDIKGFEDYPYTFSFSVDNGKTFHKISNKETPLLFGIYEGQNAKDFYKNEYKQIVPDNLDDANILVRVSYGNDSLATAYKVTMVDSTAPTDATVRLVRRNTDTMYVLANAIENDSYITKYEFKIDDGNYVDNGGEPSFKFSNVSQKAHTVTARISNVVGDSVEVSQVFDPAELVAPTITAVPGGTEWHKKKTVTMTFPMNREDTSASMKNDYVYQYKVFPLGADAAAVDFKTISEKECEVTTASSACKIETDSVGNKILTYKFEITDNRNVIAQVSAGTNKKAHTAVIDKVDGVDPTIKGLSPYATADEIRLHINGEDNANGSGIAKYECSIDGSNWHDANGTVCVFSGLTKETKYKMYVKASDNAGNTADANYEFTTLATTPKITFQETREGKGKKITIQYPNFGDKASYRYKIGSSGTWIPTTSLSTVTSLITVNNTPVYAEVYDDNGNFVISGTINVVVDIVAPTLSHVYAGARLYNDPTFASGINSTYVYNNSKNGTVTNTRTAMTTPVGSYALKITTNGTASPGLGGFYFATPSAANKIMTTRIIAKIPVGYNLAWASNATGNNRTTKWLTSTAGTGDWKEYIFEVTCGSSGTFSSTNFYYLSGAAATSAKPVTWYVAYATVYSNKDYGTRAGIPFLATDDITGVVGYGLNQSSTTPPTYTKVNAMETAAVFENISKNGTYYLWVKDDAGNVTKKAINVDRVDTTAPTKPTILAYHTSESDKYGSGWTNKQVYTKLSSTDAGGVVSFQASKDQKTWNNLGLSTTGGVKASGTTYYGTEPWTKTNRNETWYFRAVDKAGNISPVSSAFVIRYDVTAPTIRNITNSSGSNWTFNNVIIKGNVSDGHSGVNASTIQYSYNKSSTATDWSSKSTTAFSGTWSAPRNQPVYIRVADNVGNWSGWYGGGYVRIFSALKTSSTVWGSLAGTANSKYQTGATVREDSKTASQACHEWYCQAYVSTGNFGGSTVSTNWGSSFSMSGKGDYSKSGWKDFGTHCQAYGNRTNTCNAQYTGGSGKTYKATSSATLTSSLTG